MGIQKAQLKEHWKLRERKNYNHLKKKKQKRKYEEPEKKMQGAKDRY